MSTQIPGIPQTATGTALVNHINDRLRRISQELGTGATGAAGKPGAPGTSAGTLTAGLASHKIVVAAGPPLAAIPMLAKSNIQQVVLTGNTNLSQPAGLPTGSFGWTLVVDNPGTTAYSLIPDTTYALSSAINVEPGTRTTVGCLTTQSGNTMMGPILANQVISTL